MLYGDNKTRFRGSAHAAATLFRRLAETNVVSSDLFRGGYWLMIIPSCMARFSIRDLAYGRLLSTAAAKCNY
jgi:hypothetical protein